MAAGRLPASPLEIGGGFGYNRVHPPPLPPGASAGRGGAKEGPVLFHDTSDLASGELFLRLRETAPARPEKGWVPSYAFDICLPDGTAAGYCNLRIGHNEKTYYSGNIGYGIDEAYRGRRYAAKACRLLMKLARKHGMDYLLITCDPANAASACTCELAGARLLETARIPQDHDLYAEGKRTVRVYRLDL